MMYVFYFFSVCANIAVLVSVLFHRKSDKVSTDISKKDLFLLIALASLFLSLSLLFLAIFETAMFVSLSYGFFAFFTICAVLFVENFAKRKEIPLTQKALFLLFGVSLFALFATRDRGLGFQMQPMEALFYDGHFFVYIIFSTGAYIYSLYKSLYALKLNKTQDVVLHRYLSAASISALVMVFAGFLIFPAIGIYQYEYVLGLVALLFVIPSYMAVLDYKPPSMGVIFRKLIYGVLITLFVFLLLYLLDIAVNERTILNFQNSRHSFLMIAAVFITILYMWASRGINSIVTAIFLRSKINYSEYTSQLSRLFVKILDLRELLDAINSNLVKSFNLKKSIIFLKNRESGTYNATVNFGYNQKIIRKIVFTENCSVIKILEEKELLMKKNLRSVKNELEKDAALFMDMTESEIYIPLNFSDELLGFIAIQKKGKDFFYAKEEYDVFCEFSRQASIALANAIAYENLKKTYLGTVETLTCTIEAKDKYTRGHSERVMRLSVEIAKEMGMNRNKIETIRYASKLHDIGKIGVGDEILGKPGKLTTEEFEKVKKHPTIGESIVRHAKFLGKTRKAIKHHHERWDGNGYPAKLQGENIPDISRIISVADSFDAITSKRPYHKAKSIDEALKEIVKNTGTQFDPEVVAAFEKIFEKGIISEIISRPYSVVDG